MKQYGIKIKVYVDIYASYTETLWFNNYNDYFDYYQYALNGGAGDIVLIDTYEQALNNKRLANKDKNLVSKQLKEREKNNERINKKPSNE